MQSMITLVYSIFSLLLGIGIILVGSGFLGTLLGMRATLENFSEVVTGLIMSAYFLGFIAGAYLCPPLINRVGHIRAFAAMAAVASSAILTHAMIIDPWAWAALRLITGICGVGLYMVIESWLNAQAANQQRGRIFAVYMTVNMLAMALGQYLLLFNDISSFVPFALIAILYSLGLVPLALTRVMEPRPIPAPALRLHYLYGKAPLSVIGTLTAGLLLGAFWGMGAVFAKGIDLPDSWVAGFMSAAIIGGALLQLPIGRLSDGRDRRQVLLLVSTAGAVAAAAAFVVAQWLPAALVTCIFLFGGFAFPIYALCMAHLNDHLHTDQALEATSGLLLTYGIGATIGPAAAGALMSALGPKMLLLYFCVLLLIPAAVARHFIGTRPPLPVAEKGEFVPMVRTSQAALETHPGTDGETGPTLEQQ
ncbi:MAG: MFS transporter [Gammaproteobacteria bacterium]